MDRNDAVGKAMAYFNGDVAFCGKLIDTLASLGVIELDKEDHEIQHTLKCIMEQYSMFGQKIDISAAFNIVKELEQKGYAIRKIDK